VTHSTRSTPRSIRETTASLVVLAAILGVGVPYSAAQAALPAANGLPSPTLPDSQISKLLQDAENALKAGNMNLALIHLKNAVRLAPQNGAVRAQLASALLATGDATSAERELRQALNDGGARETIVPILLQAMTTRGEMKEILDQFPDPAPGARDGITPDILRARAIALQLLGQTGPANAAMDRALAIRRDLPALLTRAQLSSQQGDVAQANRALDEAIGLSPANSTAQLMKASLLRQGGDNQKALATVDAVIKANPNDATAAIMRIEILIGLNQDAQAKMAVDAILKQTPTMPVANFYRAVLLARAKDYTGAWRVALNLPAPFVQSQQDIWLSFAEMANASGNLESAGASLTSLLAKFPNATQARLLLSAIRLRQDNAEAALSTLAPIKDSNDPRVHALTAQAYLKSRRYEEAIASFEKANVQGGNNDLLKRQLALSELAAGREDEALRRFKEVAERDPNNPDAVGPLVAVLMQTGKYGEALTVIDAMVGKTGNSPIPRFYRGQVLDAQGNYAGAISEFSQSLAIDPKFIPSLYYRATVSLKRGDLDQATNDLRQVVTLDSKNVAALLKQAEMAANRGDDAQSTLLLAQAMRIAPNDPAPRLALANYHVRRGDYAAAQTAVTGLLQVARDNSEGLVLQGQIQFVRGEKEQSVRTFRQLVSVNPQSASAQVLLGGALNVAGDNANAEAAFKKAVELEPGSAQVRGTLISFQTATGKPNDALATARAFGTAYPGLAANQLLADTFIRLRRFDEATDILTKSQVSNPESRVAIQLSLLAVATGNPNKGLDLLSGWLAKNPNDPDARRQYATMLLSTGKVDAARKEYETALKLRPDDPVTLNNLAWIIQKDEPDRAIELASRSVRIAPRAAELIDTLGWMKVQGSDQQGGLALLQRAYGIDKENPQIGYHLAVALDKSGKRAEAKSLLQSVLTKTPNFDGATEAKQLIARW